jgi:hypothetical protein
MKHQARASLKNIESEMQQQAMPSKEASNSGQGL